MLPNGKSPFKQWLSKLNPATKVKILEYLSRLSFGGSQKNVKPLGDGLFELKINFGAGYRVGGDKSTQRNDMKKAKKYWREYALQNRII